MHRLNVAGKADLRFLGCVCGIDDEVDILIIVLSVQVEDFAIVDDYIGFDKL